MVQLKVSLCENEKRHLEVNHFQLNRQRVFRDDEKNKST